MVLISVIIPVHNAETTLDRCIKSVIDNTYNNLEIILVENGSNDSSKEKCFFYENSYSNIHVITDNWANLSHARNIGISAAHGEYIAFADSDDYLSPMYYEKLLRCAKDNDSDYVFCNIIRGSESFYNFDKKPYDPSKVSGYSLDSYYINTFLSAQYIFSLSNNKLIKKDLITRYSFDESLLYMEDRNFFVRCVSNANHICYYDEPLYYYYQNSNSISAQSTQYTRFSQVKSALKDVIFFTDKNPQNKKWLGYAYASLLQFADFRLRQAKKNKLKDLEEDISPIAKDALHCVWRSKLPMKYKIRFLGEHYINLIKDNK